jgi:translation initiation factor IF-2
LAKATTRVHLLAKELGVKSKTIIEKCQAEGLDIKNHMSTITIGLAATIREWFSEGEHGTVVETTDRVDLEKVKVKKKTKKKVAKKKAVKGDAEPKPKAKTKAKTKAKKKTKAETDLMAVAMEPSQIAEAKAAKEAAEAKAAEEELSLSPEAVVGEDISDQPDQEDEPKAAGPIMHEPVKPENVVPAGPMLHKPAPAVLAGPKVIRVETVDHEDTRPPRPQRSPRGPGASRGSRPNYNAPISEPLMPQPGATDDRGKKGRGRGKKHGEGVGTDDDAKRTAGARKMRTRDLEDRKARLAAARGESFRTRPSRRIESRKTKSFDIVRPEKAAISEPITVKELSSAIMVKTGQIIGKLMGMGTMATANQTIATDVAEMVALEFGTELIVELKETLQKQIENEFEARERSNIEPRPPVITMLGHVDHGKTSLLDRIRSSAVADGEAGGITQHIGAYQVEWKGKKVTFLDTPGHAAFTAMRARGANMTDIVVLVVAADDGVMPQTIEAIHHAKAADVEIVVALNKIDLPGVDINRIYGQLAEHELTPSEWGGDAEIVKTSAQTGEGIDDLIEHFEIIAELKDYKADSTVPATGWVVESKMTTTHGAVATILLKEGCLHPSDVILAGNGYGRVRTMVNSKGKKLKVATSAMPVEISGLSEVPQAGDQFFVLKDINRAKEAADQNKFHQREKGLAQRSQVTLDNLFSSIEAGNIKELNLILKADVQGSIDVLNKYLTDLSTDEIKIKILHAAVGGITESDIVLAEASNAVVIGFSVAADSSIRDIADAAGVDIRLYNIIYRITEDLKDAMLGMLDPEFKEKQLGELTVRQVFRHSNVGAIAGCYVQSGMVTKKCKLRLIRDGIVVRDNCVIDSLKHFKDDAKEVKSGLECGVKIVGFDDVKIGDKFEAYEVVEIARTL